MAIVHITTFLQGGAGNILTELACAQKESGEDVLVLTDNNPVPGYESYPEYIERLRKANIPVKSMTSFFRRDVTLNVVASEQVRNLLIKHKVKFIHAHAAIPALIGLLARSSVQHFMPVILTMHGIGNNKNKNHLRTDVAIMNMVDKVIPVSQASADQLLSLGVALSQLSVIPNGLSNVSNSSQPASSNEKDQLLKNLESWTQRGIPVFGCIGTIGERKNQASLIRALSLLKEEDFICLLIGDEEIPGKISQMIQTYSLDDKVFVTGYRKDIRRILKHFTCLVLPSKSEGLPISVLEAFREGIPVIGSNISAIKELVEHKKTGLLFDNENDLAVQLSFVLKNPQISSSLTNNAYQLFQEKYTFEIMLQNYRNIYDSLLKEY